MDRKLYRLPFRKDYQHDWLCPSCDKGLLRIKNGTLFSEELAATKNDHDHPAFEPDWIRYTYSCLLKCTNEKCNEIVSSIGNGFVDFDIEEDHMGESIQAWNDYFEPVFFNPNLKLIFVPDEVPSGVVDSLTQAFKLFFCSPSAAANHVRSSVEALLTDLKVKRYETVRSKRRPITLHRRIELLPAKYSEFKELLMAVKWLGNAGSHSGQSLTSDDVMDALEIMEHTMAGIYEKKATKLNALAKKVIKNKGPAK